MIWFVRTTFALVLTASFLQGIDAGENYLSLPKQYIDFLLPAPFLSPTLHTFQQRDVVSVLQSVQCTTPAASVNSGISSALALLNNLSMYVHMSEILIKKTQFFLSSSDPSLLKAINDAKASLATASTAGKQITTACKKAKAAVTVAETNAAAEASTYLHLRSSSILFTIFSIEKSAAAAATAAKQKEAAARASAQKAAASQAAAAQQAALKAAAAKAAQAAAARQSAAAQAAAQKAAQAQAGAAQTAAQKEAASKAAAAKAAAAQAAAAQAAAEKAAEAKSVAEAKAAAEKALWEAAEKAAEAAGKALVAKLQGSSGGKSGTKGGSKGGSQGGSKPRLCFPLSRYLTFVTTLFYHRPQTNTNNHRSFRDDSSRNDRFYGCCNQNGSCYHGLCLYNHPNRPCSHHRFC